jgi:hypothetical protein
MRCEEFEERIHESLDQRIAPGSQEALHNHARGCPSCNGLLASYEQLSDGLNFFEPAGPGEGFSRRVVEQVSVVRAQRRRVAVATATAVAVLAAACLFAVLPSFLWRDGPHDIAAPNDPTLDGGEATIESPNVDATDAASSESASDKQKGVDIEQAHIFWDEWASRISTDRWKPVDRITGEFAPITEPLSIAIDEIRSAIPLGRSRPSDESSSDSADAWRIRSVENTA